MMLTPWSCSEVWKYLEILLFLVNLIFNADHYKTDICLKKTNLLGIIKKKRQDCWKPRAAACFPNPRSCTWIIATREPCLSNICIYWVTGVSLTQTVQWIAACDLICIEPQTSKTLSSNHFSHTSVVRVWCWFCLMLGVGLRPYTYYSTVVEAGMENIPALHVNFKVK